MFIIFVKCEYNALLFSRGKYRSMAQVGEKLEIWTYNLILLYHSCLPVFTHSLKVISWDLNLLDILSSLLCLIDTLNHCFLCCENEAKKQRILLCLQKLQAYFKCPRIICYSGSWQDYSKQIQR